MGVALARRAGGGQGATGPVQRTRGSLFGRGGFPAPACAAARGRTAGNTGGRGATPACRRLAPAFHCTTREEATGVYAKPIAIMEKLIQDELDWREQKRIMAQE